MGEVCLKVSYHMEGPNMGHLFVLLREGMDVVQYLWGDGGLTTSDWRTLRLTVNLTADTQVKYQPGSFLSESFFLYNSTFWYTMFLYISK